MTCESDRCEVDFYDTCSICIKSFCAFHLDADKHECKRGAPFEPDLCNRSDTSDVYHENTTSVKETTAQDIGNYSDNSVSKDVVAVALQKPTQLVELKAKLNPGLTEESMWGDQLELLYTSPSDVTKLHVDVSGRAIHLSAFHYPPENTAQLSPPQVQVLNDIPTYTQRYVDVDESMLLFGCDIYSINALLNRPLIFWYILL